MDGGRRECRHGCLHVVDGADGLVGGEVDTDIDVGEVGTYMRDGMDDMTSYGFTCVYFASMLAGGRRKRPKKMKRHVFSFIFSKGTFFRFFFSTCQLSGEMIPLSPEFIASRQDN